MASKRLASELARFRAMPPSVDNTGAGGGTYRQPYYGPGGGFMLSQNQPGVSDFGQDAGGRWTTTDIAAGNYPRPIPRAHGGRHAQNDNANPLPLSNLSTVRQEWAKLVAKYPQYTKFSHLILGDDKTMGEAGANAVGWGSNALGNEKGAQAIGVSALAGEDPATVRFILGKELGQVMSAKMLGPGVQTDQPTAGAAAMMQGWNVPSSYGPTRNPMSSGLPGQGSPDIMVGGAKSYPEDLYGNQFAHSLGLSPDTTPHQGFVEINHPDWVPAFQAAGLLPRSGPMTGTVPSSAMHGPVAAQAIANNQRMTDFMNRLSAAKLAMVQQRAQGAAQQNSANAAMRGGARNF